MSVLDTIRRFSKSTVTLYRLTSDGGIDANGRGTDPAYATVVFEAVVQPMAGADRKVLPEGNYVGELVTVWSADQQLEPGDELECRSVRYKVVLVRRWDEFVGGWKAFCARAA